MRVNVYMKQIVGHKEIGALKGVLLVLGLVVLLVVNELCLYFLSALIGFMASSLVFWVIGALIAMWMLRVYVMKFEYELSADVLRLNRSYGKRPRHIEDVYLNRMLYVGDVAGAKKRYPKAKKVTAYHSNVDLPCTAVVYKTADDVHMAVLQANDELKARLMERAKR